MCRDRIWEDSSLSVSDGGKHAARWANEKDHESYEERDNHYDEYIESITLFKETVKFKIFKAIFHTVLEFNDNCLAYIVIFHKYYFS